MAYSELVKRFDRVRDYMRDFLIFGYKTRGDFSQRSARTYDNERRRIESWLGDALRWEYRPGGKAVFLSLDAAELAENPLCRAWRSKSFTDRDITLHFFLLDLLAEDPPRHAEELTDLLAERWGLLFDLATVRRKLKEYESLGLLTAEKQGRRLVYRRNPCSLDSLFPNPAHLPALLRFFGETAPLAVIGSFLESRLERPFPDLRFKHHFIVHTLEDQILLTVLTALRLGQRLELTNVSGRNGNETVCQAVPLKILVSVQTGRRYLAARPLGQRRFTAFRLDYIKAAKPLPGQPADARFRQQAEELLAHGWGPALRRRKELERLVMTISLDEEREPYILQRLRREGRGGTVTPAGPGLWRYEIAVYDTAEMMNWVKTFTGRIVSLEGDNPRVLDRFASDIRRMAEMYGGAD